MDCVRDTIILRHLQMQFNACGRIYIPHIFKRAYGNLATWIALRHYYGARRGLEAENVLFIAYTSFL